MNEPKIARRCSACGASIRKRAMFCPQCGQALSVRSKPTSDSEDTPTNVAESRDTIVELRPDDSSDAEKRDTVLLNPDIVSSASVNESPDLSKTLPLDAPFPPTQPLRRDGGVSLSAAGVQGKTQPLTRTPRVEATHVGPVQKLRKVSSVVLDQAAYDPSIRFLLVAAVLFILFLFLLIMSKVLN